MNLIINQMVEFEVVWVADRDALVKRLAGPAVIEDGLAVFGDAALLEQLADLAFVCTVENRGDLPSQRVGCVTQMDLRT